MVDVNCNGVIFRGVDAIVFDKDGTLADSGFFLQRLAEHRADLIESEIPGIRNAILTAFGIVDDRFNPTGLMAVGSREENERAIAKIIGNYASISDARSWVQAAFRDADRLLGRKAELTPPFPGIFALLQSLSRSCKLGIVSSDSGANIQEFVDCYELNAFFGSIVGAEPQISKPNPRLLLAACRELNASPAATLLIGDAITDVELARQGNAIGCVGVTWGGVNAIKGADAMVNQPNQIDLSAL